MFKKKPTASEVDGVQYRRAKLWQIICYACNGLVGMSVYSLIGMASYSASIGYGITTAAVGIILTCSRILDGITDPLLAFVYDRVNTKFGKLRILMVAGYPDRGTRPLRNVHRLLVQRAGPAGVCPAVHCLHHRLHHHQHDCADHSRHHDE